MRNPSSPVLRSSLPERELFSIPLELVSRDSALTYPIYVRINERPILFRPQGDSLTTDRATRLKEKIDTVAIPKRYLGEFLKTVESRIDDRSETGSLNEAAQRLRNLLLGLGQSLQHRDKVEWETLTKVNHLASRLAAFIRRDPSVARSLLRKFSDPSVYYVNHNINVAIYAILMGEKLNLSLGDLKRLAYGCLVHNIGNVFVPDEILYKSGTLTKEEWEKIQYHPMRGAQLMEQFHAPEVVVRMIREHHERADGKGYPNRLSSGQIHLFSKICTIADVYDALTSHRPYRTALSGDEAIRMMRAMTGKFDTSILRMLESE